MTTPTVQHSCSCCGRELPRRKLHALAHDNAFICRRCGLWDPRVTFDISAAERALLESAESHLLGLDTRATRIMASPVTRVDDGGSS